MLELLNIKSPVSLIDHDNPHCSQNEAHVVVHFVENHYILFLTQTMITLQV